MKMGQIIELVFFHQIEFNANKFLRFSFSCLIVYAPQATKYQIFIQCCKL